MTFFPNASYILSVFKTQTAYAMRRLILLQISVQEYSGSLADGAWK